MTCRSTVITKSDNAVVVAERTDSLVLIGSHETVVIADRQNPAVIAFQDGSDIVVAPHETSQVFTTAGTQGPPGPPGKQGEPGPIGNVDGAFLVTERLGEIAGDAAAQEQAQSNLGLGITDPLAYYILAKA